MTETIRSEEQLEELLSRPNEADVEAMRALDGDILLLGAGGKMGPSLAVRAKRAMEAAGVRRRVIGVSRFSDRLSRDYLEGAGVETESIDLMDETGLQSLPDAANVIYMAARKFGSTGNEDLTWAINAYLPAKMAERYVNSRITAFSTGNVYALRRASSGGSVETDPLEPVGEYGQSAAARERLLHYFSTKNGTPISILRLNYAIDLRYGVLLDIGTRVFERRPVDLGTGLVNVIWQGDANSICLRSLAHCQSPPFVLNLTGPETLSVRWIAAQFAERFGVEPEFMNEETDTALLNNAARCHRLFGYPTVSVEQMIEWVAAWIGMGGRTLAKPTKFEVRDGRF
jgi:nucleoside-diphosphate-sugar epimerase